MPIAALFLLPLEAFAYWVSCPMETMLFTALFVAAIGVALQERRVQRWRGSSVLFVLLALTRPEGAYLFVICAVVFCVGDLRRGDGMHGLRRHVANVTLFTSVFGGYFVWRYQYYGSLLPNTFYAKVTGGEVQIVTGLTYLRDWCVAFPLLGAMLVVPPVPMSMISPVSFFSAGSTCGRIS